MRRSMLTLGTGTAFGLGAGLALNPLAFAQSGALEKAVGGYSFEEAAKESSETKNFHSNDGVLTFAIVTHTAGNGFFERPIAAVLGVITLAIWAWVIFGWLLRLRRGRGASLGPEPAD